MTDDEARKIVAKNLQRIRDGRSYADLGRAAQTSAGAIRDIEIGDRMPGIGLLSRLADALNVPISEFLKK